MISQRKSSWLVISLVLALVLILTGCGDESISVLNPSGPVAEQQLGLMKLGIIIMVFVVVVVFGIWGYVLFRFRKRKGEKDLTEAVENQVQGNHVYEIIWTVIPFILLVILAVPTLISLYKLDKTYSKEEALQVKVVGHQFWWEFQYPDLGITTAQDLYIPTGKKIQFDLSASDVIHSFWVPAIAGKTDTNPNDKNTMWFQADKEGIFRGKCAELCGASHALMDFKVVALSPEKFKEWEKNFKAFKDAPQSPNAKKGQALFKNLCIGCHAVGDQGGKFGPSLTQIGDRTEIGGVLPNDVTKLSDKVDDKKFKENMYNWLTNTDTVKPGNKMGVIKLTEDEKQALIEYLAGLKVNK
jgi:cytochrome c oxidase subunit 2